MMALYSVSLRTLLQSHPMGGSTVALGTLLAILSALFLELHPIPVPSAYLFDDNKEELALSSSVYLAVLLLFGPALAILVGSVTILLVDCWRRKPFYKAAFNAGQYVVAVGVAGLFLEGIQTDSYLLAELARSPQGLLTVVVVLGSYFLLNQALAGAIIAMVDGTRLLELRRHAARLILLEEISSLDISLVAAILWMANPLSLVLLILPIMVTYLSSKTTSRLKSETYRALVAVAEMVESRDPYSYRHSMEVARISAQIATRMRLPLDQAETVKLAGQLHDIGKMGTPDYVLNKPGSLTEEEWALMRKHPANGAKVLQYFSLFQSGVDLVLYHQEHFDGSGYPGGLAGEEIPLGARIIHVADAYQAMTSDRVYRKAMEPKVAVERLLAASGVQFDPEIVKALVDVLRESGVQLNGVANRIP